MASHRGPACTRVQDAYSLRCAPQVHGAARDTVEHAAAVAGRELAAAVDNPVVLAEEHRVESNGNFHGAPVAYVLDFLAIVAADVASGQTGDNFDMEITLITPIAMEQGLRFAIREGGRTVGSGVVAKVIE